MVQFGDQYETQKIPEWYNEYLDYLLLAKKMEDFSRLEGEKKCLKLPGLYFFSAKLQKLVNIDFDITQLSE